MVILGLDTDENFGVQVTVAWLVLAITQVNMEANKPKLEQRILLSISITMLRNSFGG